MLTGMASRKKSGAPAGCLFWLAFLIVVVLLYLVAKPTIDQTLKNTGFWEALGRHPSGQQFQPVAVPSPDTSVSIPVPKDSGQDGTTGTQQPARDVAAPAAKPGTKPAAQPEKTVVQEPAEQAPQSAAPSKSPQKPDQSAAKGAPDRSAPVRTTAKSVPPEKSVQTGLRKSVLYFVTVDTDGSINRQAVRRSVNAIDAPLSDTIKALLAGPNAEEMKLGYISLIPQGTKLLSAMVRDSTAYLNFNDNFQFNTMGIEGYAAQLKQIVFTATEFSNVHSVQILINGEKHQYLGAEGVFIGAPISRADL